MCADANVSGCQPAESINNSSDWRTETSSSTTNTIGALCETDEELDAWSAAFAELRDSGLACDMVMTSLHGQLAFAELISNHRASCHPNGR